MKLTLKIFELPFNFIKSLLANKSFIFIFQTIINIMTTILQFKK